jgi:hypothetical protein
MSEQRKVKYFVITEIIIIATLCTVKFYETKKNCFHNFRWLKVIWKTICDVAKNYWIQPK